MAGCATNLAPQYESAKGMADALALDNHLDAAGRHLAAFADRQSPGNFYRSLALLQAADYYAAAESRGAAMAALNRCLEGTPDSSYARRTQDDCRQKRQAFSGGAFTTAAQARRMAASWQESRRELDREEEAAAARRPAAPVFVPPPVVIGAPPVSVPGPGTQPAGSNRGMPRNYCVPTQSVWRDVSSGRRLHVVFKNNCPIAVKIGWCEQRADGSCGSGGGSPDVPPGGTFATTFLGGDAVRARYIACSAQAAGYNTSRSLPEWYCSPDR